MQIELNPFASFQTVTATPFRSFIIQLPLWNYSGELLSTIANTYCHPNIRLM